jgi:drug/metabolite transporter (DMT)-like permease
VVAGRTLAAAVLLFLVVLIFQKKFLYIYPLGALGCFVAGALNGIGSLFFYAALARIDAGLGQLLYSLHPVYVAVILYLDGQRHSKRTLVSLVISLPALILLTVSSQSEVDLLGSGFMLLAGLLYALHIPINQRVLYDVPAPTVTLYTLIAMAIVVTPPFLALSGLHFATPLISLWPLLGLTLVTFLSRLTLFAGVKSIGGLKTALLGLAQLIVSLLLALFWLGESLSFNQWLGAALLILTLILSAHQDEQKKAERIRRGWLYWLRPRTTVQSLTAKTQTPPDRSKYQRMPENSGAEEQDSNPAGEC